MEHQTTHTESREKKYRNLYNSKYINIRTEQKQ